jgi:hypothetical protein
VREREREREKKTADDASLLCQVGTENGKVFEKGNLKREREKVRDKRQRHIIN